MFIVFHHRNVRPERIGKVSRIRKTVPQKISCTWWIVRLRDLQVSFSFFWRLVGRRENERSNFQEVYKGEQWIVPLFINHLFAIEFSFGNSFPKRIYLIQRISDFCEIFLRISLSHHFNIITVDMIWFEIAWFSLISSVKNTECFDRNQFSWSNVFNLLHFLTLHWLTLHGYAKLWKSEICLTLEWAQVERPNDPLFGKRFKDPGCSVTPGQCI